MPTQAICSCSGSFAKATLRKRRSPIPVRKQCTTRKEPMKPLFLWLSGTRYRRKSREEPKNTSQSRPHSLPSFTPASFSAQNAERISAGKQRPRGSCGSVPPSTQRAKSTAPPSRYRKPHWMNWYGRSRTPLRASKKLSPMTATFCTFIFPMVRRSLAPGLTAPERKAGHRR